MQLFSRKTLLAVSLGALSVLGACGDDVVVDPGTQVLTISPPSASLNIGESATFVVQISGGADGATIASCTSSAAAVATATLQGSGCRVTAVSAGNTTITATSSTGTSVAAQVTVTAQAAAISDLTISPTTANVGVGQSVTLVPNVSRANSANTVTYTYQSSSNAIATVNAQGVVTAVAPGIATITVTANGSGTGYSTTTLTTAATINVSNAPGGVNTLTVQPTTVALAVGATSPLAASVQQPAGAPAAVVTYGTNAPAVATVSNTGVITAVGQGNAVITVTATSPAGNGFGASTLTQLVQVTVNPPAQVSIGNITTGQTNNPVDITNVQGQIQVALNVTPNGQNISSVQIYVCDAAETDAQCSAAGRRIAAQQTFTGSTANSSVINMFINTAEFDGVDFTTGVDANTFYKNGQKRLIATATVAGQTLASNNIALLNFNNQDGYAVQVNRPANRQQGVDGFTYYGGPDTPDALLPGSASGTGSFTVVPVIYTPARTIRSLILGLDSDTTQFTANFCGVTVTDSVRPFSTTYGTRATVNGTTTQTGLNINCTNASSLQPNAQPQVSPWVIGGTDNNNDAAPATTRLTITPNLFPQDFRLSTFYRPTTAQGYEAIALDYRPPAPLTAAQAQVRGGNLNPDSGFVNAAYAFAGSATNPFFSTTDDGVGLPVVRVVQFEVFNASQVSFPAAGFTVTGAPVATGGLNSTVQSLNIPESADLTNGAYYIRYTEVDRLGNRRTVSPTSASSALRFGVDLTAPTIVAIPNTGVGAFPNAVRTDRDSVFSAAAAAVTYLQNPMGHPTADNAVFAIRFTDSRSGFYNCVAAVNCPGAGTQYGGNYQITRRIAPPTVSVTNDALVQNLVTTGTVAGSINATLYAADNSIREFSVPIFGDATRASATIAPTISPLQAGYYTFTGTIRDRAGNTATITQRSAAIDNATPTISTITVPPVLTGGATNIAFQPTGSDDLEVISADLALTYPQLGVDAGAVAVGQPTTIRFRRVPNYSPSFNLGFFHNPFQAITDNKLATPVGPGTFLGSTPLTMPMPFIQSLQTVNNAGAPLNPAGPATAVSATDAIAQSKPTNVSAWLHDIRSTVNFVGGTGPQWSDSGRSTPVTAPIGAGQVSTSTKNWAVAAGGAIQTWQAFNSAAATNQIEFRVATSTTTTNPPFTRVDIVRLVGNEWEYLGVATFAGTLDQGATRFYRYTFSYSGANQGQFDSPALTGGQVVKAIGSDAQGNALATNNTTFGQGAALASNTQVSQAFVSTAVAPQTLADGATLNVPLTITPAAPAGVGVAYTCSANNAFVTTAVVGTDCVLTANGAAPVGGVLVTVTIQATGAGAGFTTTTVTRNDIVINRIP